MSKVEPGRLMKREGLADRLATANGRRRVRVLDIDDVSKGAGLAEFTLDKWQLPLSLRPGVSVTLTSGDRLPNAYRVRATETRATLLRRATGWEAIDVTTGYVPTSSYARGPDRTLVGWHVSQTVADWLFEYLLIIRGITVTSPPAGGDA